MRDFAQLVTAIDSTTSTRAKTAALVTFFRNASDQDRLWTVALFTGRRPRRVITTTQLREWAAEETGIPLWLFEECYPIVGDLAETITLLLPPPAATSDMGLADWIMALRRAYELEPDARRSFVLETWACLDSTERFIFNKLITGGFRIGVSRTLITRALAQTTGRETAEIELRLMGDWTPDNTTWAELVETDDPTDSLSRPYPFYLAHQLPDDPDDLGEPAEWAAEWKWDGIRGQLICREGSLFLWSRGEELMTDRFPEMARALDHLPSGTVLDGEILAWDHQTDTPRSFNDLQKRIGRKKVSRKMLGETPVVIVAYDVLEIEGRDIRQQPYEARRTLLAGLLSDLSDDVPIRQGTPIEFADWSDLAEIRAKARAHHAEGVMLKRRTSPYLSGRKRGDWWKWKLDPHVVDAVMIYAQAGSGRRANLFTDFTFAVRDGNSLVPFAKAYSGLTDDEFRQITQWVRRNTQERFGPVRRVTPELVFEIAFEGISESPRHKSGIALRFPRMLRWRRDKPVAEINTLDDLKEILHAHDLAPSRATNA